jgi:hypothetical protein
VIRLLFMCLLLTGCTEEVKVDTAERAVVDYQSLWGRVVEVELELEKQKSINKAQTFEIKTLKNQWSAQYKFNYRLKETMYKLEDIHFREEGGFEETEEDHPK